MKPIGVVLMAGALLALTANSGLAQYVVSAKSGTVNFTEGQVQLDGQPVESSVTHYAAIKEGSVLRTGDGRAEVLLTPGITLRLGDHASLKMITNRLIDTRLELLGGSAVVEAGLMDKGTSVTVVVNAAAVSLPKTGIYRFNFDPAQVKVFKGEAAVLAGAETTLVGAGRMCAISGTTAAVEKLSAADTDALDHWSHRRGELMSMANTASANAFNSAGGVYNAGYSVGLGTPLTGCSSYGNMMMPGFGYSGSLWSFANPYSAYPGSGFWSYNCWYGMYTFMPLSGMMYSPYGYPYVGPSPVQSSPTAGPVVKRPPIRGPLGGPVTLLERHSLTLAVNGFHTPGFRGGITAAHSYGAPSSGYGSFANSGSIGSVATSSLVGTSSGSFSGASSRGGGAVSGAVSSGGGGGRR